MAHETSPPSPSDLSVRRRAVLWLVLTLIVGGHLFCLLSNREELWPFSRYAMYSQPRDPVKAEQYVLVGIERDDPSREIELFKNWEYLRPHYRGTLHGTFQRLARANDFDLLKTAAADCLRRYEQRREERLHDGPALAGIRVYLYTWRYANVDPTTRQPTDRQLVAEALLADPGRPR